MSRSALLFYYRLEGNKILLTEIVESWEPKLLTLWHMFLPKILLFVQWEGNGLCSSVPAWLVVQLSYLRYHSGQRYHSFSVKFCFLTWSFSTNDHICILPHTCECGIATPTRRSIVVTGFKFTISMCSLIR